MPIYLLILFILTFGILVGYYFQQIKLLFTSFKRTLIGISNIENKTGANRKIENQQAYFNVIEMALLNEFYHSANKPINEKKLGNLFEITGLNFQQKKQTRGILLKELNIKFLMIYGLRNGIIRINHTGDKRIKLYALSDSLHLTLTKNKLAKDTNSNSIE